MKPPDRPPPPHLRLVKQPEEREPPILGGRCPPNDQQAEMAVISGAILSKELRTIARYMLTANSFYSDAHRLVFDAMAKLEQRGIVADGAADAEVYVIHLAAELREQQLIQRAGGATYLGQLIGAPVSAPSLYERTCRLVLRYERRRKLIGVLQKFALDGYGPDGYSKGESGWETECLAAVTAVAEEIPVSAWCSSEEAGLAASVHTERAHDPNDPGARGLELPLENLQEKTGGLFLGETTVLTAPTGGGKTLLASFIAEHIARTSGLAVGVWSLEMPPRQLMHRLAVSSCQLDASLFRTGTAGAEDLRRYHDAVIKLRSLPLFFDGRVPRRAQRSASSILSTFAHYARKVPLPPLVVDGKARGGLGRPLGLMVLDFVQKLDCRSMEPHGNRERQLNIASELLVREAEQLGVALLILCQVNNDGQVRESAAVTHHAQNWWDLNLKKGKSKSDPDKGYAILKIKKARHGDDGNVPLWFDSRSARLF